MTGAQGVASTMSGAAFAWDAPPGFDPWMGEMLARLAQDVRQIVGDNLVAVLLGGGYGRGEGAVVWRDGRHLPYNDLDLFLVVHRPSAVPQAALQALGARYAHELGDIEVDFGRPLSVPQLRTLPAILMYHDLVHGHRVLLGPPEVLTANTPARLLGPPSVVEASRLLLNRGAGLLWSMRVTEGHEAAPDPDFARRNLQKARLAAGDALLLAANAYTTLCAGRQERLAVLVEQDHPAPAPGLLAAYAEALRFKRRPDEVAAPEDYRAALAETAQLWGMVLLAIEWQRLGGLWPDLAAYVAWPGLREAAENAPGRWLRNLVRGVRLGQPSLRHPRERLYRELPVLLRVAGPTPADWPVASAALLARWRKVQ